MAIIRAITQVGISIKDVLRELRELNPSGSTIGSEDDELLPEEMEIVKLGMEVVTFALGVVKESIRFVGRSCARVEVMEEVSRKLQKVGEKVDDLGACIFPPQEMAAMVMAAEEMLKIAVDLIAVAGGGGGDSLVEALEVFAGSLRRVVEVIGRNEAGVETEMREMTLV